MPVRKTRKLGNPVSHVNAVWVEFSALQYRIEDTEERSGVHPAARDPLPADGIVGQVGVHERVPEPRGPVLPGYEQVFYQKGCDNHPHPVVHPARGPEFAHSGVHYRVTRPAALPETESLFVACPGEMFEFPPKRSFGKGRPVAKQVLRELPPDKLTQKRFSAFFRFGFSA